MTEALEARLHTHLERTPVPGCAIAYVQPKTPVRAFYWGARDLTTRQPVDAATRFHLFSGTKLYTAAALMRLVEERLVDLDAPVVEYLPELPLRGTVTVRHLSSHSSGLPETLKAFLAVHFVPPAPSATDALQAYRLDKGKHPGRKTSYGNVNFAILGALIEAVSGQAYTEFVRRTVLEPLSADVAFTRAPADLAAVGHVSRFSPMRLVLRLLMPDVSRQLYAGRHGDLMALRPYDLSTAAIGGLVGPALDFIPLVQEMLTEQDGILRATSKREMLTLHSRGAAGIDSTDGVGIGWKRGTLDGTIFWNHEGGGAGFCSETRIYPNEGIGVVILMNHSQSRGLSRVCTKLCEEIRRALPEVVKRAS